MLGRHRARARALAAVIALSGCGSEVEPAPPSEPGPVKTLPPLDALPPDALGPYGVGVTTFEVEAADDGRALPVEVWYPAVVSESDPPAIYELSVGALVLAAIESPRRAVRDAPADLRGAGHPVVVFSHGFGGVRIQSVYLTEYLASHGFVVAAPDHLGNTFQAVIDDSIALPALEMARLRPMDVSRTLDALLARSATLGDPLEAMADPARVGVAGHSFGGYTAFRIAGATIDVEAHLAACAADPDALLCGELPTEPFPESARDARFIAALPQAPGGAMAFGESGFSAVSVPTMIQAGTIDETTPFEEEAAQPYAALPSSASLLAIEGAGHFTFSDMCTVVDELGLSVEEFEDGCGPANVPAAEAHTVIDAFATAFLQVFVAGEGGFEAYLPPAELPAIVASFEEK